MAELTNNEIDALLAGMKQFGDLSYVHHGKVGVKMSQRLTDVLNEGGEFCRNCSAPDSPIWRVLNEREIEACPNCGDGAYDAFDFDEDDPY